MTTHIHIRPADGSPQDAAHFASLADIAQQGLTKHLFGWRWHSVLSRIALKPGHALSAQTAYFLTVDDNVAGMVSGFTGIQSASYYSRTGMLAARIGFRRLPQLLYYVAAVAPSMRQVPQIADDMFYIQYLAIYPQYRGLGLSPRLLKHAEAHARSRGCAFLGLDVVLNNERAKMLYELYGFSVAASTPSLMHENFEAGAHRMVMHLRDISQASV